MTERPPVAKVFRKAFALQQRCDAALEHAVLEASAALIAVGHPLAAVALAVPPTPTGRECRRASIAAFEAAADAATGPAADAATRAATSGQFAWRVRAPAWTGPAAGLAVVRDQSAAEEMIALGGAAAVRHLKCGFAWRETGLERGARAAAAWLGCAPDATAAWQLAVLADSGIHFSAVGTRRLADAVRAAAMCAPPDPAAGRVAWVLSPRRVDDRIRRALEALAGGLDPELAGALLVRLSYAADAETAARWAAAIAEAVAARAARPPVLELPTVLI
jgi:hypothetical protein